MRNRLKLYFVILGFVISAASTAHAAYTFPEINFPGSSITSPYGINNSGNIVGYYYDGPVEHGASSQ